MKCSECHFENPGDTRFCGNCGTLIKPLADITDSHTKTVHTPIKEMERGTTIADRYEIIEELGRGGMGNVYRVVDKKINEEMALKLLHPAIAAEEKTIKRFKNELKLARKITHKNVCRMYDFNEEEGTPYITMEYVPGEDLKNMIRMTGQLSVGRAVSIAKQICEGLAEAHRLGVVHRDLKSRNIMIDREGNARIMDFGIARFLKAEGITGDGIMVGTPEYMSPEQVKGEEADHRSDIYSFGIILFEMVTGKIPFEGDTSFSIAFKHKTEIPPDPKKFNTQIPEEFSAVILKCMEKEREKRFQGVEELASELSSIEKEISTEEKIPTKGKTRRKPREKRFHSTWLIGIISVALIAVLSYVLITQIQPAGEMRWKDSIAVLPIEDQSEDKDQGSLCGEMTLDIIEKLSKIEGLNVKLYGAVWRYPRSSEDDSRYIVEDKNNIEIGNIEIGKRIGVKKVLKSYLIKEDDEIQIRSLLFDAYDNSVIDVFKYSEESGDIIAIQYSLTRDIAITLGLPLAQEIMEEYKKIEPKNSVSYSYFASGRDFEEKYGLSYEESDFITAKRMYEEAIRIDPEYARAYFGLGILHEVKYNRDSNPEDLLSMYENLKKAHEINPNLAEAHVGLGWANFYFANYDEAFKYFESALEIEPPNSEINYHKGAFFLSIGLYHQAIKFCSKAVELDPLNFWSRHILAYCSMYVGDYDKAAECFQKALDINPNHPELLSRYAFLFIFLKDHKEAERILEKAEKIGGNNLRVRHARALLLAIKGEKEEALQLIKEKHYSYFATSTYSLLGMNDKAVKYIREGIEKGLREFSIYLYPYPFLKNNPCFDNLRDDTGFKEIVKEEKKKYEERRKKYGKL